MFNQDGSPYTGHAGGVAVSKNHVWVASESSLFPLKISDLVSAEDNDEIQFSSQTSGPVEAAYTVYDDGILWLESFMRQIATLTSQIIIPRIVTEKLIMLG
ncbi:hypothetical protein ACFQ3N_03410 [Virgibacillus byunsanensis]|uniref:Uncharacterized protein n=1 Tax=Virgibacillus byunsanensis TaxID=570945 RepID=A0ABW3LGF8_9BACI